jgi:hypothetical protein
LEKETIMKFRLIRTTLACIGMLAASAGVAAAGTTEPPASSETAGSSEPCVVETTEPSDTTEPTETTAAVVPVIDPGDGGNYAPDLDPANFVETIDNPYLPLTPGSRWVYQGAGDAADEHNVVEVLDERKDIMGISAVVVHDSVFVDEIISEDTYDWYAQDIDGNVWYLGEDSQSFDECGQPTDRHGSWEYGVDGALPGIVMLADPAVGDAYRQEYYAGTAEDMGEVLEVGVAKSIELGDYGDVVVTEDWNPLEPDVVENKWYAAGVGVIHEEDVSGGNEVNDLVEFTAGG